MSTYCGVNTHLAQCLNSTSHRRLIVYTVQHYFTPSNPQASAWCGQPSSTRTCWRTGCRWTPAPTSPSPPPGAQTGSSGGDPISTTMIAKNDGFRSYQMTNVRLVDDCWPVTGGKLICGFVVSVPSRAAASRRWMGLISTQLSLLSSVRLSRVMSLKCLIQERPSTCNCVYKAMIVLYTCGKFSA